MMLQTAYVPVQADSITERIFGPDAVLHLPQQIASVTDAPIEQPVYRIITVAVLLLYLYLIYVFSDEIGRLFSSVFRMQEAEERHGSSVGTVSVFVTVMCLTGWVSAALLVVEYTQYAAVTLPVTSEGWLVTATVALLLLWRTLQWCLVKVSGMLAQSEGFCRELLNVRSRLFSLFSVVAVPVCLLAAFGKTGGYGAEYVAFAALFALYWATCFFTTFYLFVKEKVSILFWFLYLCAVDIMPIITLVVLMLDIR